MLIGNVIGDDVDDRADPKLRGLSNERLGLGQRPESRIDRSVVSDVVAPVGHR